MQTKHSKSSDPLAAIGQAMAGAHGLDISVYEVAFLRQAIAKRLAQAGLQTMEAYGECLAGNRAEAEAFCRSLHVGYSEFFRDPLAFALLEQQILPALIAARSQPGASSELRIWSAGCAAGQEAWSVAILLDALCGPGETPFAHRIFATDMCESELCQARAGVYSAAAVDHVRLQQLQSCFARHGDAYTIVPRLHARVAFSLHDLLDARTVSPADSLYGDFDLILCCNLLFYYRSDVRQRILDKVCRTLSPGGYLVTGEVERAIVSEHAGLRAVAPPAAVFQKNR